MEPLIFVTTTEPFTAWMLAVEVETREVWVCIHKKRSGKQQVTFEQLLEEALYSGWVDAQTKSVDDERYGIRFVGRRPQSNWSETNRAIARQLLKSGRI